MTNGELFRRAADYIREHGWRRWGMGFHGGPRCAVGALRSSAYDALPTTAERRTASRQLHAIAKRYLKEHGHRYWSLMVFNDVVRRGSRNGAHVINLFEGLAFAEDLKAAATAVVARRQISQNLTEIAHGLPSPTLLKEAVPVG